MTNFLHQWQWRRPILVLLAGLFIFSAQSMAETGEVEVIPVTNPLESNPADSNSDFTSDPTSVSTTDLALAPDQTVDVLQELVMLLDQESELATKSKMNIDFVPGIMSVLHGKDLIARGVQNVYEALGLIPGVEISRTNDGQPQILVRGIGKSFFSSKIKMLLNNTSFNATLGAATTLLILPIEQVERIEVIRGPGSAIYGEYASVGVINVITRKDQNSLFIRNSTIDKQSLGGMFTYEVPGKDLKFNVSLSQVKADGGDVEAGSDILFGTPLAGVSNAPGKINNAEEHESLIIDVDYKDYSINLQRVEQGLGDFFGLANALPEDNQDVVRKITMQGLEVSRDWKINAEWDMTGTFGLLQFKLDSGVYQLFPAGFSIPNPMAPPPAFLYPNGVLGSPNYEDDKYYVGAEFNFSGLEGHELLLGAEVSFVDPDKINVERNYTIPLGAPTPLTKYEGVDNWLEEGHDRRVIGVYVQDQFLVSEDLKLTLGLRFDHYDDVGSDVTPRVAGVYHLADMQTLKFQFASSFRPPTFLELYTQNNLIASGNEDLESERIDTLEAGYVYNSGSSIFRSTFFYFVARDLITINSVSRQYENQGEITSAGLEIELQHQLSRTVKIDATVTRLTTENDQTDDNVTGVAELISNVAFILQPWPDYAFGIQFKAIGDRAREPGDNRPDLDGYTVIDVTANFFNLGVRSLNLRTGVKNIFDNDIVYPAPLTSLPGGVVVPGYLNDYPQSGREVFLQLDYQFD